MPFQFPWPWPNPNSSQPQNPNPRPNPIPNPFLPLQTHLTSLFSSLQPHLLSLLPHHPPVPGPTTIPPAWARIEAPQPRRRLEEASPAIEERLAGVPVYALTNGDEEFVLVTGARTLRSLGLFCFRKEDADALLAQMAVADSGMRAGSRVVPVALNKVVQLKINDVAFRLVPDSSQVANAIKVKEDEGEHPDEGFPGVPVFQSKSLVLWSDNKRYRPFFFRKEDLDDSVLRTSRGQGRLNPAFMRGDIQVCTLEDIITSMKDGSSSTWDDVVFIPPGFNLSSGMSAARS